MAILRAFGFLVLASLSIRGGAEEDATPTCSSSLLQSKADRKSVHVSDVHLSETLNQSAADPSLLDKIAEGGEKCVTVGQEGVGPNVQCAFPFTWRGVKRSNCTSFEWDKPWCSTKVDATTGMHVSGQWGICGAQCTAEVCVTAGPAGDPPNGGVGPGVACKFPFRHNGILHTGCAKEWKEPWCSTQVGQDGTSVKGQWGICGNSCPTRPSAVAATKAPPEAPPSTTTSTTTSGDKCTVELYGKDQSGQGSFSGWKATFTCCEPGKTEHLYRGGKHYRDFKRTGARNDQTYAIKVFGTKCTASVYEHGRLEGLRVDFSEGTYNMGEYSKKGAHRGVSSVAVRYG